jgi:hypothetical protein
MKRSRQLIATIKEQQIQPIPRWRIMMKRGLWVAGFVLAVLLGGLAFSVILLAIQQADLSVLSHLTHSRLEFFLGILPILWLGGLAVFVLVAYLSLRRAPRAYKLSWSRLFGITLVASVVVGGLYFLAGGAGQLEAAFARQASWYESLAERKARVWSNPAGGLLAGRIEGAQTVTLILRDFSGQEWTVTYAGAFVAPIVELAPGDTIKLLGAMTRPGQFTAREVRPWRGPGFGRFHRGQGPHGPDRQ